MRYVSRAVDAQRSPPGGRIPELDGLRALAITLVLLGHFGQFSLGLGGIWTRSAEAGVLLFFVLSGYLITSILCSEHLGAPNGVDLRRFYVRRATRLVPAALVLIATMGLLKLVGLVTDESWIGFAAGLLYIRNVFGTGTTLGHLWSLSLEEQFYLVWPLLFVLLPGHRLLAALTVVVLVVAARAIGIGFALQDARTGVFYMRPWFRFDSIMAGCLIALLENRYSLSFVTRRSLFATLTHPLPAFGILAILMYYEDAPRLAPWSLTLQTFTCVLIVAGLLAHSSALFTRLLSWAPLTLVGRASYSLYLWQQVFVVTKTPDWGWVRRPYFDLLAAALCAGISWRYVERSFRSRAA